MNSSIVITPSLSVSIFCSNKHINQFSMIQEAQLSLTNRAINNLQITIDGIDAILKSQQRCLLWPSAWNILRPGISRVLEHIATKFQRLSHFPVSSFSIVPLPVSHAVDISQKSKMAVAKMKCTDFTAIWLKEDNFLCTVSDFIVHVHNEKNVDDTVTPETGSSFNLG